MTTMPVRFDREDVSTVVVCHLCEGPGPVVVARNRWGTGFYCLECVDRMARTLDVDPPRRPTTHTIIDDEPRVPCKRCALPIVWVRNEVGGPVPVNGDEPAKGQRHVCKGGKKT